MLERKTTDNDKNVNQTVFCQACDAVSLLGADKLTFVIYKLTPYFRSASK